MKWVALVVLLVIGPYTFLRWHYRKPAEAFEPYHDLKDQANTKRLLSAGFSRITLEADRPAEPFRPENAAVISSAPGGVTAGLAETLIDRPVLPTEILAVTAPAEANTFFAYSAEFTCALPDFRQQPGSVHLYVRDEEITIVPDFERLTGDLNARTRQEVIRVTVPAGRLKPGTYQVTLVGERASRAWTLLVK
jgi:hypothetical protein